MSRLGATYQWSRNHKKLGKKAQFEPNLSLPCLPTTNYPVLFLTTETPTLSSISTSFFNVICLLHHLNRSFLLSPPFRLCFALSICVISAVFHIVTVFISSPEVIHLIICPFSPFNSVGATFIPRTFRALLYIIIY